MDHFNKIRVEFTSTIAGKLFNVELWKDTVKHSVLLENVTAESSPYEPVIADDTIDDDDDYFIRVVASDNVYEYKDSEQFVIQKKMRCGGRCGSKL